MIATMKRVQVAAALALLATDAADASAVDIRPSRLGRHDADPDGVLELRGRRCPGGPEGFAVHHGANPSARAGLPELRLRARVGLRACTEGTGLLAHLAGVVRRYARGLRAGPSLAGLAHLRERAGDRLAEGAGLIDGRARVVDRARRLDATPRAATARLADLGDRALLASRRPSERKERERKGQRAGS